MALIPKNESFSPTIPGKKAFDPLKIDCPPTDNVTTAQYAFVGDFPTSIEVLEGAPFAGPSGSQFNRITAAANIPRYTCYLTTACKAMPPKKNFNLLWTEKGYRQPAWGELQRALIEELSQLNCKVIMLLGATPMRLLIDTPRFSSIAKYRGSCYHTSEFPHLSHKLPGKILILSYHPAFTLVYSSPVSFYIMLMDMNKMKRVVEEPELITPNLNLITKPEFDSVLWFYDRVKYRDTVCFDIECTPDFITCFSLAIRNDSGVITSMCIPLMDNSGNYWTVEQESAIWTGLAEILIDPAIGIICQNGMFDLMFILRTMNIISDNFYFDTMLAQHLVYTELPKGLDFLTSVYTYHPYYKDEGKQSHLSVIKDWPSYWAYNAKDSAYLFEITDNLQQELIDFECVEAQAYQMALHKPLMEMEFNGILTDQEGIAAYRIVLSRRINALQHGLNKLSKSEININSAKQMIAYFYGTLMIKPYLNKKNGNPSCDTIALHRIAKRGKKGSFEAKIIIKIRQYFKLLSTYFNINVDEDNRLRCGYRIAGTVSGRISSNKTFFGTGANLQNQPYAYKKYLMAD